MRLNTPGGIALLNGVLAVALLSGLLLSPKLWLSGRSYPLVPGVRPVRRGVGRVEGGRAAGAQEAALYVCRLIVAATYAWSGVQAAHRQSGAVPLL